MARILVIDDDSVTCRTVARLLRLDGHDAVCAHSAREALESLDESLPSLLILDVMLPDLTGLELLRMLRTNPRTANLPAVMYTAAGDHAVREAATKLGAADVVVKGRGWPELGPLIHRALENTRPA